MHEDAAVVLESLGGDPSNFTARQFTGSVVSDVDLIITMTTAHRESVLEAAPRHLRKAFTLTEAARLCADFDVRTVSDLARFRSQLTADQRTDVPDPIGQSSEVFAAVGSRIAELLPPILALCQRSTAAAADQAVNNR
jgi:protein-tyrosine phosphatase